MSSNKFFIAVLFLVFSESLMARPVDVEKALVKISSESVERHLRTVGSGFLFTNLGKVYLLTSEHTFVAPHFQDDTVSASTSDGKKLKLLLLNSDWKSGLALFEVTETTSLGFTTDALLKLDELALIQDPKSFPSSVLIGGYPATSQSLTLDPDISVSGKTESNLFATSPDLLQMTGETAERGMSGGLVMSEDLDPLGILVQKQFAENNQQTVLAIPISRVNEWLKDVFKRTDKRSSFTRWNITDESTELMLVSGSVVIRRVKRVEIAKLTPVHLYLFLWI